MGRLSKKIPLPWLPKKVLSLTPAEVAAGTTSVQTFTCTGLRVGDVVSVFKPTAQAGLAIAAAWVSAANQLAIQFANITGAPITPTEEDYTIVQLGTFA